MHAIVVAVLETYPPAAGETTETLGDPRAKVVVLTKDVLTNLSSQIREDDFGLDNLLSISLF